MISFIHSDEKFSIERLDLPVAICNALVHIPPA